MTPYATKSFTRACLDVLAAIVTVLAFVLPGPVCAAASPSSSKPEPATASLIADHAGVSAGQEIRLGLRLKHEPGWHTYWRNPGDSGLPTRMEIKQPEDMEIGSIEWPAPEQFLLPPLANYGYDGELLLVRKVRLPETFSVSAVTFRVKADWLVCRELCLPGKADLSLTLPVTNTGSKSSGFDPSTIALFEQARSQLPGPRQEVEVVVQEGSLLLHLPSSLAVEGLQSAQFFPFANAWINQAAAQPLLALPDGAGWQLRVPLATDLDPALKGSANWLPEVAEGVLVINDRRSVQIGASTAPSIETPSAVVTSAKGTSRQIDSGTGTSMIVALVSALLGGLILNLMPCVFPVIGLKILGFAGHGGQVNGSLSTTTRRSVRHGSFWFSSGIVVSFLVLANLMLVVRAAGQAVGWGFQMQSPIFIALMALLFVAIGLNFSGLFEFGTSLTQLGNLDRQAPASVASDSHNRWSAVRAFGSGALAVLVATPCTAPFMGSALGYTMSQSTTITLLVFSALGVGMALPYIVLGLKPDWLRFLPRPGKWMESLRQVMAFPMFAAAVWLAWVLGKQSGPDAIIALLLGSVVMGLGLWIYGRHAQFATNRAPKISWTVTALAVLAAAVALTWDGASPVASAQIQTETDSHGWQSWSRGAVEAARASNQLVFVDFTAAWCISCQVNKKVALETAAVKVAFKQYGVVQFRADWTRQDKKIADELARHGRNGVPLYLLYRPGDSQPEILPAVLTPGIVIDAIAAQSAL